MPIIVRRFFAFTVALLILLVIPSATLANRADGALRDTFYFSPSWGYSMRWYADEWSVASESSQDGTDILVLQNSSGATIRFEGRAAYQGDARACLDDQLAALEAAGAQDIAVLTDDAQRPQKIYHPWRSWMLLIAGMPGEAGISDEAIYLDCRTLQRDEAVIIRELRMPAADFANDLAFLDVLNVALPRGSWLPNVSSSVSNPAIEFGWTDPPLPVDSLVPTEFPASPQLLSGIDGELGMVTVVDGDLANQDFVIVIENTGSAALDIDPAQFVFSNLPTTEQVDPDVTASSAIWTDGTAAGPRSIPPGQSASLLLHFLLTTEPASQVSLVFWDPRIHDGGVPLTCITKCGYGGGGSRPKVRAMR